MFRNGFIALVISCSCFLLSVRAQGTTSDSLDWHRYFPMQVGNAWEYATTEGPPIVRREVIATVEWNDRLYYQLVEHIGTDRGLELLDTLYLRYDEVQGRVLSFTSPAQDTLEGEQRFFIGMSLPVVDLRAGHGDTVVSETGGSATVRVDSPADAEIRGEIVSVSAMKTYSFESWTEVYATDVGLLFLGSLFQAELVYANVGGSEYGKTVLAGEGLPFTPDRQYLSQPFPNPTSGRVSFSITLPDAAEVDIEAFNMLGARQRNSIHQLLSSGRNDVEFNLGPFPSGQYALCVNAAGDRECELVTVLR